MTVDHPERRRRDVPARPAHAAGAAAAAAILALAAPAAAAQPAFPSKAIRILVGAPAGGSNDIFACSIGQHLEPVS